MRTEKKVESKNIKPPISIFTSTNFTPQMLLYSKNKIQMKKEEASEFYTNGDLPTHLPRIMVASSHRGGDQQQAFRIQTNLLNSQQNALSCSNQQNPTNKHSSTMAI
uniref:Uncharacterized protein n=1 Tax=Cucumis melo TaxID=3656 RepID=A0A9I9E5Z7_CUCME